MLAYLCEGSMAELNEGRFGPPTDEQYMARRSCSVDTLRALSGHKVVILAKAHRPPISNESRERGCSQHTTRGGPC